MNTLLAMTEKMQHALAMTAQYRQRAQHSRPYRHRERSVAISTPRHREEQRDVAISVPIKLDSRECLLDVSNQILGRFNTAREANQVWRDACRGQFFVRHLTVG